MLLVLEEMCHAALECCSLLLLLLQCFQIIIEFDEITKY